MNLQTLQNEPLPDVMEEVAKEAKNLGASRGAQRLVLLKKHYQHLSLEEAYSMLDPEGLQCEVEEAQERNTHVHGWRVFRNCFSLFPLILTWASLWHATTMYQADLASKTYGNADQYQPFLRLWQDGFHNATPLTFSAVAFFDVCFLVGYVLLIWWVSHKEKQSYEKSREFAKGLHIVTDRLLDTVAQAGTNIDRIVKTIEKAADDGTNKLLKAVTSAAELDIDKIVQAMKSVIADAHINSDKVALKAQKFIEDANNKMNDLYDNKLKKMIDDFHGDISILHLDLSTLGPDLKQFGKDVVSHNGEIQKLTDASSKLVANAGDLTKTTNAYVDVGKEIRDNIGNLNTTQQSMVSEIKTSQQEVVKEIGSTQNQVVAGIAIATGSMNSAAQVTESVANKLGQITKQDVENMTKQVVRAADSVSDAADELTKTKGTLASTNQQLQGSVMQVNQQLDVTAQNLNVSSQNLAYAAHAFANATKRRTRNTGTPPNPPQPPTTPGSNMTQQQAKKRSLLKRLLRVA